jgi:hypothetical protein
MNGQTADPLAAVWQGLTVLRNSELGLARRAEIRGCGVASTPATQRFPISLLVLRAFSSRYHEYMEMALSHDM